MKWYHPNHVTPDRDHCPYYEDDYSVPVIVTLRLDDGDLVVASTQWMYSYREQGWVECGLEDGPSPADYSDYGVVVAWAYPPEPCGPNDYAEVTDV